LEYLGLHNKLRAEVHPGHKLTDHEEEEDKKEKKKKKKKEKEGEDTRTYYRVLV
jgi:hypothetical protein